MPVCCRLWRKLKGLGGQPIQSFIILGEVVTTERDKIASQKLKSGDKSTQEPKSPAF